MEITRVVAAESNPDWQLAQLDLLLREEKVVVPAMDVAERRGSTVIKIENEGAPLLLAFRQRKALALLVKVNSWHCSEDKGSGALGCSGG
jgi:hypothetical protein